MLAEDGEGQGGLNTKNVEKVFHKFSTLSSKIGGLDSFLISLRSVTMGGGKWGVVGKWCSLAMRFDTSYVSWGIRTYT
jgi:hypothetical protein